MPALFPKRWSELSAHIDELLTLPPLDRARRLDELAANDPATAAELRDLLAAHDSASASAFMAGVAVPALATEDAQAGDRLGPWTLVDLLGEGGMGAVWRARRSDGRFEGDAAIKLLKSGRFDAGAQERFRREGAILAHLHHPGIARLLDAGISPTEQPYLVLELVQGERIDRWCEARALGLRARIELMLQVMDAVAAAHAQLAIHRDLKPSNILVTGQGQVKLLDFGIARLLPGAEAAQTALTREGSLAMTPEYAAPEQFEGGTLSVATDVYALGVVLFELLVGAHPRALPAGAPALAHLRAAVDGPFTRPSVMAAPALRPALRGDLDNILDKALRSVPEQRYAGVSAFADDLRAHLQHRPVAARPDALVYRLGKFVRRNRLGVALGALALVATLAGVAGTLLQAQRAAQQARRADAERAAATAAAAESDRLRRLAEAESARAASERQLAAAAAATAERERQRADREARQAREQRDIALETSASAEGINDLFAFLFAEAMPSDQPFTPRQVLERGAALMDTQQGLSPKRRVEGLLFIGGQLVSQNDMGHATPLFERARTLAYQTDDSELRAQADCWLAVMQGRGARLAEARQMVDHALQNLSSHPAALNTRIACQLRGAELLRMGGDFADAVRYAERARDLLPRMTVPSVALEANTWGRLAGVYRAAGRVPESAAAYARMEQTLRRYGREETRTASHMHNNWGLLLLQAGAYLEARRHLLKARQLESATAASEGENPALVINLATLRFEFGEQQEALADLSAAARSADQRGEKPLAISARLSRLSLLRRAGRLDEARAELPAVEAEAATVLPPQHPGHMSLLSERAMLDPLSDDETSARFDALMRRAAARADRDGLTRSLCLRRAAWAMAKGRRVEAAEASACALAQLDKSLGRKLPSALTGEMLLIQAQTRSEHPGPQEVAMLAEAAGHFDVALGPEHPRTRAVRSLLAR